MQSWVLQVTLRGTGSVLTASAQHSSEASIAKQQAALDLIHQLQQAIILMLTASQPDKVTATAMHSEATDTSAVMKTLHEGDRENSTPEIGNVVKVQYQLIHDPQTGPSKEDTIDTEKLEGM